MRERLIQLTLRARDFLSRDVQPASDSVKELTEESKRLKAALNDAGTARSLARTLRDNEQATEGLERSWKDAKATLDDLTREYGENERATAGQRIAMREAKQAADAAERAYKRNQSAIKNTTSELNKLGVDTKNIVAEEQRLTNELNDGKQALDANRDAIKQKRTEERKAADAAREHASALDAVKAGATEAVVTFGKWLIGIYLVDKALQGLGAGIGLVKDGIRAMVTDGNDQEQALAQLESALASTGNAAGLTAQQLLDMADAFEASSMLTAEQVQAAQTRLLSYTDVAATEFPRAMQIIIDQQQRLGISVEQSAEIVGRALQSPSEAIATLGRQGFKLEDGQKRLLRQLEATGKTAEAQAVIMDMLTEAYGGSAAAARLNTFAGLWKTITDQFGDFAGRVAKSGAFDFIKGKLAEVAEKIEQMSSDGSLDALAKSLSNAFIQGAEKVEDFTKKLLAVDFETLTADASRWLDNFGEKLDTAGRWITLITAPVRVLFNIVTGGIAAIGVASGALFGASFTALSQLARLIPQAFGGDAVVAGLERARDAAFGLMRMMASQIAQDGRDVVATWKSIGDSAQRAAEKTGEAWGKIDRSAEKARQETAALAEAMAAAQFKISGVGHALAAIRFADTEKELRLIKVAVEDAFSRKVIDQSGLEQVLAAIAAQMESVRAVSGKTTEALREQARVVNDLKQKQAELLDLRLKDEISLEEYQARHNELSEQIRQLGQDVDVATVSIKSYQDAQAAFSTASSVAELRAFQKALFDAYTNKDINLQQFQEQHNAASVAIRQMEAAAGKAAGTTKALGAELKTLADVQRAISDAKTDRDIAAVNAALKKMLDTGIIDGAQYNAEMKRSADRLKELKTAIDGSKKAQDEKNDSDKEAIKTSEQLRRESGKRMEQERRASGEAMERNRKDGEDTKRDMSAFGDFFGGVISRAREPLAALSAAALAAYDKLRGVTTVDLSMDTSGLEATTRSLEKAREELGKLQAQANTVGISGFGRWMTQSQVQSQQVQVQYLAQKASLQRLMEGYEDGSITLESFVRRAAGASGSLNLLNDADLSSLDGALESAKQRMEQFGDSTRGTLAGLQMELLQLNGTQEEIERARFASRRDELRAQQAQAQTAGDSGAASNLRKALQTLDEIESATANKRLQDAQQKRSEEAAKAAPAQAQLPTKVIRLETARGQAVNVALQNDRDETNLLSILQDAGLRSL